MASKEDIIALEMQLVDAMKSSDVATLEKLLADNLLFTNHNGHLLTKQDDLNAHLSDELEIFSIDTSAQLIELYGDTAIVSVVKDLSSSYQGHASIGIFRFTRVWHNNGSGWQVVAAHSSQVI